MRFFRGNLEAKPLLIKLLKLASKEHDSNDMKANEGNLNARYSRFWKEDLPTLLRQHHPVTEGLLNFFHCLFQRKVLGASLLRSPHSFLKSIDTVDINP